MADTLYSEHLLKADTFKFPLGSAIEKLYSIQNIQGLGNKSTAVFG